jgi:hypothetical protein
MNQVVENFNKIIIKLPQLISILSELNSTDIKYGLYAGSHVAILTSNRIPTDVDFLVADEDFSKLINLFPLAQVKDSGNTKFLYADKNNKIEFMSFANVDIKDSHYSFRLSDLVWKNSDLLVGDNFKVRILHEVDTILLKAMLQRGEEVGKHDLEDIKAILQAKNKENENLLMLAVKEKNMELFKFLAQYSKNYKKSSLGISSMSRDRKGENIIFSQKLV